MKTFKNQAQTKGRISISIIDEGLGINGKKMKDLVFSNLKKNAENEGFGLGLFIVNNFIKDLNGIFELTNNHIAGCTAKIELDIEIDQLNSNSQNYNLEGKKYEKLNVLLVESDITNSYTLQKILERKGHKVKIASEGKEAISILMSSKFDILLIGDCLTDINIIDLIKSIRLGEENSDQIDIPIIGLSANADSTEMKDNLAEGMNDFITKPINIELLIHKMNGLTSNKTQ